MFTNPSGVTGGRLTNKQTISVECNLTNLQCPDSGKEDAMDATTNSSAGSSSGTGGLCYFEGLSSMFALVLVARLLL